MIQKQNSLINQLNSLPEVTNAEEYYSYIKIDTTCPITYCHEYLVLYAQLNGNELLITDLNSILEDADYFKINPEVVASCAMKNNLSFDGVSVFKITNFENLESTIKDFFNVIKTLKF